MDAVMVDPVEKVDVGATATPVAVECVPANMPPDVELVVPAATEQLPATTQRRTNAGQRTESATTAKSSAPMQYGTHVERRTKPDTTAKPPATAQVNVRMARDLKDAGDAALARAGISPSEIVRAVWAKAAEGDAAVAELTEALGMHRRTPEEQAEIERKRAVLNQMVNSFEELGKRFGLDISTMPVHDEDEDWHEAVWKEREEKWRAGGWRERVA